MVVAAAQREVAEPAAVYQCSRGDGRDAAKACWAEVAAAAERVMARRFAGVYCGGCDCLENLAGKVLV